MQSLGKTHGYSTAVIDQVFFFPDVRCISLKGTDITDDSWPDIAVFSALSALDVSGTQVTSAVLPRIGNNKGIEMLDLAQTQVADENIDTLLVLPRLEYVNISGTNVTSKDVLRICNSGRLRFLVVSKSISDEHLAEIQAAFPKIKIRRTVEMDTVR